MKRRVQSRVGKWVEGVIYEGQEGAKQVWVISSLGKKNAKTERGGCSFHAKWPLILQSKISFYKLQEGGPWSAVFWLTLRSDSRSGNEGLARESVGPFAGVLGCTIFDWPT